MRNLICIAFILSFSLFACNEDSAESCTGLNCDLIGEWDWTSTYGSIAGNTWTPETENVTRTLIIDEITLRFFEDGNEVEQFTYEVFETDTMFNSSTIWTFIRYDNWTRILEVSDTELAFKDFCPDCFEDYYERK